MKLFARSGARSAFWGLLAGLVVALSVVAAPQAALAEISPVADKITVVGANRGDADSIKGYFQGTDQASVNRGVADLSATGMFSRVSAKVVNGPRRRLGRRRLADHQPRRLRGQQSPEGRPAWRRGAVEELHVVQQGGRRRGRSAHQRGLQEDRPERRDGHVSARRAAQRARRSRVQIRRGRQDRHQVDQLHRQQQHSPTGGSRA